MNLSLPSLAWIAVASVGMGATGTFLMAKWIPESVGKRAAEHGRFVGLGEAGCTNAPYSRQAQHEAMNVVSTAN